MATSSRVAASLTISWWLLACARVEEISQYCEEARQQAHVLLATGDAMKVRLQMCLETSLITVTCR
jgi:hypothetical protein